MSASGLLVRCPAKVNLYLRILGRRPDGYHELDTVFQAVDLWDTLVVRPDRAIRVTTNEVRVPVDDSNLVVRAARRLGEWAGIPADQGVHFHLLKEIPLAGGLGGGSSDAAAALLACARLWGLDVERETLAEIAGQIGADVPYFLWGGTARGSGRGDRIEPLPSLAGAPVILGCPPFGLSTAEVFSRAGSRLTLPGNDVSFPLHLAHKWPEENDFSFMVNDLEHVVFAGWPVLERFRDALVAAGARRALLSGSGSTVYGIFADEEQLVPALGHLGPQFHDWRLIPSRTVEASVEFIRAEPDTGPRPKGS